MGGISFYAKNKYNPGTKVKSSLKKTLSKVVADAGYKLSHISIIMMGDDDLLQINRDFLDHDYYTDIITFDNSETEDSVDGELYISTDRIRDNAAAFGEGETREFCRVVIHGVLHLVGYGDKTKKEKSVMREKENHYLTLCGY